MTLKTIETARDRFGPTVFLAVGLPAALADKFRPLIAFETTCASCGGHVIILNTSCRLAKERGYESIIGQCPGCIHNEVTAEVMNRLKCALDTVHHGRSAGHSIHGRSADSN